MGDKYYKPILKDGDHLVRSSKNPDRVRGLSRDENNKNPDIIEWEEVDAEEISQRKPREELELELESLMHEEQRAEMDRKIKTHENINSGLEIANNVLVFLNENPEITTTLISIGKKVKHTISGGVEKTVSGCKTIFRRFQKKEEENTVGRKERETVETGLATVESSSVSFDYSVVQDDIPREEISIDEARKLIIDILADYIGMKRKIERLSRAKIDDFDMPQLDMNQVLASMENIVEKYPALMDERTYTSVMDILKCNNNMAENQKILAVLHINEEEVVS